VTSNATAVRHFVDRFQIVHMIKLSKAVMEWMSADSKNRGRATSHRVDANECT
jgi:hypothetical protein